MFLDVKSITDELVNKCIEVNMPVEVWTVNDTDTIKNLNPYITGVTSDNLIAGNILYDANIN